MTPSSAPACSAFSVADLDPALQQRLIEAAGREEVSLSRLCEGWLLDALERHEHSHGVVPASRCSVRTGQCTSGPVPLPLQQ